MFHGSEGSTTVRKRDDEEWACQAFLDFLRNSYPALPFTCRPVPPEEEPPDFWLETHPEDIALEVTSVWEQVLVGGRQQSTATLECWAYRLIKEIEENLIKEAAFEGKYLIEAELAALGPEGEEHLRNDIADYVSKTSHARSADTEILAEGWPGHWSIRKYSPDGRSLQLAIQGEAVWEGETANALLDLVSKIVLGKDAKLSKRGCPYILLLLDQYHLADEDTWESIGRQLELPENCWMVARIWDDKRVQVLAGELPDTCQPLPISPVES
ncbi:MAG: hypothetical protein ACOY7U_05225 [Acidobacteriota bacterium]